MPRIIKFRIKGNSLDETFRLTRTTIFKTISSITRETDENGEMISPHEIPINNSRVEIDEELSAFGIQSREPAEVIILETDNGPTQTGLSEINANNEIPQPVRIDNLFRPGPPRKIDSKNLF
jgi:hypothetical protein